MVLDAPEVVVLPSRDVYGEEGSSVSFETPEGWVDVIGQGYSAASVLPESLEWDFHYDGTFEAESKASGLQHPTFEYDPGNYTAAARYKDTQNNFGITTINVDVMLLPPEVSAGQDQAIMTGTTVSFDGKATDYSGISKFAWDFDYDFGLFDSENVDSFTPTHSYSRPGKYRVALRAWANDGTQSTDIATITVTDLPPQGVVVVAPTNPDTGNAQTLEEGRAIWFKVSGFADTDLELKPNLWVDWNHDGAESLVLAEDWKHQTTDENGILTFYVEHTYQDDKNTEDENFNPIFRVDDLTGRSNDSEVPLSIANVAPVATLGIPKLDGTLGGSEIFAPNEAVRVAFAGVQDVSKADLDAGMTYYFQIDGRLPDASKVPTYAFSGLAKGHTYTVSAFVRDQDGGQSPTYTYEVKVHSGIVVELQTPSGSGSVELLWNQNLENSKYSKWTTLALQRGQIP